MDLVSSFIEFLKENDRSPSTILAYKKDIQQLEDFLKKLKKSFTNATSDELEDFISALGRDGNFSIKTISRKINSLKTFYKFLLNKKIVTENIAKPIKHPQLESKPQRFLSKIEYKALRDTTRSNFRLYTMVELLIQTGIRIGELCRLQIEDIQIKTTKKNLKIKSFASNPERVIELNAKAYSAIKEWLSRLDKDKNQKGYLFPTKNGNSILVRNVRTSINRAFRQVGINDATVNDLRNTFIVWQLEEGVKLEKVAVNVGHQRLSSTEKYISLLKNPPQNKLTKIQEL